ncbi:hypothetical protein L7F22_036473 [Adiantum nelumboides]|nr:hypothetical protein [Adiantum nelumboides]
MVTTAASSPLNINTTLLHHDGPFERSSLSSSGAREDDAALDLHTHDHKRLKPATPTTNQPAQLLVAAAGRSSNLVGTDGSRLLNISDNIASGEGSPSSTANCTQLRSSTSALQAQDYNSRENPISHTAASENHEHGATAESYSFAGFSRPTSVTQSSSLAALPLRSNLSSKSTAEQAPLLQDLSWFVNRMFDDVNVEAGSRTAGGGFTPRHTCTEANYMPAGHYNERASRSNGTQGLMSLLGQARDTSCNQFASRSDPSLLSINLLGERKAAALEQNVASASTLRAQVVAHPLFEHLLAAHLACLRMGTPPEQWLAAGAEARLALFKQQLQAKYLQLLAGSAPPAHDKEHLDHFMLSLILLMQTFREQLREHMHLHSADAITGYTEIKEAFIRLTGDTSLNAMASSTTNTMSDDDSTVEDDDINDEAAAAVDAFDHLAMHEDDMHMMMMNGSMHSDIDRPLMDRVRKELKSSLKQARQDMDYRSKLWEVREEIMRKRRAGKLPGSTTSHLRHWWDAHSKWPYPTEEEKQRLVRETGLELKQINNWFINQRKRNWTTNPALERVELDHIPSSYAEPVSFGLAHR